MEGHIRERAALLELANQALEAQIAAHREVAEALRKNEERFRTLAESLPHLVWTCWPDGRCDYLNRQWTEYAGRSVEESLDDGWTERLHPEDRESVQSAWAAATEHGDTFDAEVRIQRADGEYRWFKTRAVPLRDASGRIVKWFGSHTDIEDSRQAHLRVATQLERLRLLNRITRAIAERQDLQSIFRVVLRKLEDNLPIDFGCVCLYEAAHEFMTVACIGAHSQSLATGFGLSEGDRVDIDRDLLLLLERGQPVDESDPSGVEFLFSRRLAQAGLGSVVVAPLLAENKVFAILVTALRKTHGFSSSDCEFVRQVGEHVALAASQTQIYTALQQAYEELRQTTRTVLQQERLRALGQMASGIAHDINNTISPIALYTQSLLEHEPGLSKRARQYLEIIDKAVEAVVQTVARMRDFSRPREPQLLLPGVDLNELILQVIDLSRARWSDLPQQRGVVIDVRSELSADLPVIRGAESEIRDALTNLVFNAIDAMPEGGTLTLQTTVGASPPGQDVRVCQYACIEVRDTGIGMDDETRRRCIEPFFTTKGERGTGLGLAGVYGMARRHEGILQIDSQPGAGTAVRLMFPASASESASSHQQSLPRAPTQSLRILIVDDDPVVLDSLRNALQGDGHFVTAVEGGQAGIDAFAAATNGGKPFAAVITDLGMPYVDGRKVATAIRTASPGTPVILLTGWGRLIAENERPYGVDRVLPKPPRLYELRAALAELTERAATILPTSDIRDEERTDG